MRSPTVKISVSFWKKRFVLSVHIPAKGKTRTTTRTTSMTIERCFSELERLDTFEERFAYLRLGGGVGAETFGFDRWINQIFYRSREWKRVRDHVILRDESCDLGVYGREIHANLLIHHVNPVSVDDIREREDWILDPEFLITTCHATHNAIHYGVEHLAPPVVFDRQPGDTKLW
jgi:hypothetical protein